MHSRMSRLRRSLSRGSLFNGLSKSQLSLVDLPTIHQQSMLLNKFSTPTAFPQLRQLVYSNNEILREIISIFDERASLDFAYSKTMQKLSSRLHKVSTKSPGIIDHAWSYVADQFDAQASIHSNLGSAITDDIVQPLRAIFNSQYRTIRATEQLANRELRFLTSKRDELSKIKRLLHSSSRDLEKVEQLIDNDNMSNIKLSVKKRKLLEQVMKQEQAYIEETIATERQRRLTDGVLRKGVEYLEVVEKQRLAHCQTALGRFQRKISQLGPNLNMMFERCINALNDAINAEPNEQISMLTPICSTNHTIYLCDFHAENFAEIIGGQRRRWTLERINAVLHEYLKRTQLEVNPTLPSSASTANCSYIEFLEYLIYKMNESLKSIDGTQNREYHRLARFQQKLKDKMGLTQTVLAIPLDDFENDEKPSAPSLPTTSSIEDEIEPIVNEIREPLEQYAVPRSMLYDESQHMQNTSSSTCTSNSETIKRIYRVLYDFTATTEDELDVHAGDCVLVEGKIGNDWMIGQIISNNQMIDGNSIVTSKMNNKIGRFPTSYVASANNS
ncbi:Nostrin [Dirofilaria immitis]